MVRVRIAPSPTGEDLHIGNVYTALINFVFARQRKGRFIVRIEDTDRKRVVEGSEQRILDSLKWLGFKIDEGPEVGGPYGPYSQSERLKLYKYYAEKLVEKGAAYYCFCTEERLKNLRKEQQKRGLPPKYDGKCRREVPPPRWQAEAQAEAMTPRMVGRSAKKTPYVIRLKVPKTGETSFNDIIRGKITFKNKLLDDQVLLKSDSFPTYHLGVVVDDNAMKISHIIRAEEWISSTPKHILLYKAFGWKIPTYAHLPLLRNPDHSKLSKRKNPVWVSWYRKEGFLPEAILNYLSLMGWSHPQGKEIFSVDEFAKKFSLERISTTGPVFDLKKLEWMNGEYIRKTQNSKLKTQIYNFFERKYPEDLIEKIVPLIKTRIKKLSEFENIAELFFKEPKTNPDLLYAGLGEEKTKKIISNFKFQISNFKEKEFKAKRLEKITREVAENFKLKPVSLFMTLRIALSGKTISPPLFESMEVLGKEEVLKRLEAVIKG